MTSKVVGLNGPGPIDYIVNHVVVSSTDPTWARFNQDAKPGAEYQPEAGIVHCDADHWTVIDFGTAGVGCPGPERDPSISVPPAQVRKELQLGC